MADEVRIVLADDHAILRSGLRLLLNNQENWSVVGEAGSGTETMALVQKLQPTVLLLDLNMPDGDGLSILKDIRKIAPDTRVLVLTMHEEGSYLRKTIQHGAAGYVLKKVVDTELIIAIQAVLRGELYVHSAMTQHLLQVPSDNAHSDIDPWQELSEREYDVLKRVALGHTNAEIAEALFLSPKTVETYRARGMEKLNMHTRAQLVKSAIEHKHLE